MAVTNYHELGGLRNQIYPYSSEGQKSELEM